MGLFKKFSNKDENVKAGVDLNSWKSLEYNDISIELSNLVKNYRGSYNLSQKELADIIGCDKGYIVRLEAGKLDDISFRALIEIWVKLSTPDFNFGGVLLENIHKKAQDNYEQLCRRRWGR